MRTSEAAPYIYCRTSKNFRNSLAIGHGGLALTLVVNLDLTLPLALTLILRNNLGFVWQRPPP